MTTSAAIQMRNATTLGDKLMTMLRAGGDNEIKITIKSFQNLVHSERCLRHCQRKVTN
jgi:hypothetical protein